MKRLLLSVCFLIVVFQVGGAEINWETNYQSALQSAKASSKPIVLFFTGTDWCTWCNKLEEEVLETPDFMDATAGRLIFVKLDFPMNGRQDPAIAKQNEILKKRHSVRGFPTLVIIDPDEKTIGVTGYRPGGGKQYADHILKMVNEYTAYNQKMSRLQSAEYSGKELKRLYQKARELDLEHDANLIIKVGMDSDLAHFFLTERYRNLVDMGKMKDPEVRRLKKKLLATDPENEKLVPYQIAVIEFEDYCERMDHEKLTPTTCVAPLVSYIEKHGKEDKNNLWRLHMVISQVYLDKNQPREALKYAEASYEAAPVRAQPEISLAIQKIQSKIQ